MALSLQRPPRTPFTWHIHDTTLSLEFSSFGKDIDDEDIVSCYVSAQNYVSGVIHGHGDGRIPPSLQLYWAHSSAAFSVQHSPWMTYGMLAKAIKGIETFQLTYNYSETYFKIIDNTRGEIGSGDIRSTSSTQAANSTSLTLPSEIISPNVTLPAVRLSPPKPPFVWSAQETAHLKLHFTSYGHDMDETDLLSCYVAAAQHVLPIIKAQGNIYIPQDVSLHWTHGTASLTILHQPRMHGGS